MNLNPGINNVATEFKVASTIPVWQGLFVILANIVSLFHRSIFKSGSLFGEAALSGLGVGIYYQTLKQGQIDQYHFALLIVVLILLTVSVGEEALLPKLFRRSFWMISVLAGLEFAFWPFVQSVTGLQYQGIAFILAIVAMIAAVVLRKKQAPVAKPKAVRSQQVSPSQKPTMPPAAQSASASASTAKALNPIDKIGTKLNLSGKQKAELRARCERNERLWHLMKQKVSYAEALWKLVEKGTLTGIESVISEADGDFERLTQMSQKQIAPAAAPPVAIVKIENGQDAANYIHKNITGAPPASAIFKFAMGLNSGDTAKFLIEQATKLSQLADKPTWVDLLKSPTWTVSDPKPAKPLSTERVMQKVSAEPTAADVSSSISVSPDEQLVAVIKQILGERFSNFQDGKNINTVLRAITKVSELTGSEISEVAAQLLSASSQWPKSYWPKFEGELNSWFDASTDSVPQ